MVTFCFVLLLATYIGNGPTILRSSVSFSVVASTLTVCHSRIDPKPRVYGPKIVSDSIQKEAMDAKSAKVSYTQRPTM